MKRLAFNAYLAATDGGLVIVPVKLDGSVMRGTALTVNATRAIADALRMPTPRFKILMTCVPGRATRSEATGAGSSYRGIGAAPRSGCWLPRTPPIGRWAAASSKA